MVSRIETIAFRQKKLYSQASTNKLKSPVNIYKPTLIPGIRNNTSLTEKSALSLGLPFTLLSSLLIAPLGVTLTANPDSNSILRFIIGTIAPTANSPASINNYRVLEQNNDGYKKKLFHFGIPAFVGGLLMTFFSTTKLGVLFGTLAGWVAELGIAETWNGVFRPKIKNSA